MKRMSKVLAAAAVVCGLSPVGAIAQWADPSVNLRLADRSGEQVQPKISPAPDGGAYVSWYDNSTGGYDVYVQRVNARGVEQWAHNGVLIADRSVSSTVDYGLTTDLDGNAVIAFNDDRVSPAAITLQKVSPAGVLLFHGSVGAQAGLGSTGGSPPKVCVTADGNYVVIWNSTVSPVTTLMQKIDHTSGALLWGASGITQADWLSPARPIEASDVEPDNAGGVIVLFVRCTGTNCVTSNKQLHAQRYDATGAPVWMTAGVPTPVTIFAGTGSIQTGTFPTFLPDGAGGGVFSYYETGGSRNAYIQHVLASGALKFAAPIANTGATAGRIRVGAGLAYDQASGSYYLASPETDASTQSINSVIVQKYDSLGNLLWGNDGVTIVPNNAFQPSFVQAQAVGQDVLVFYENTTSAVTRNVAAQRVNHNGGNPAVAWSTLAYSDGTTDKSRLTSTLSACPGFAILACGVGATGTVDIAVQNVDFDGTMGAGTCPVFGTQPTPSVHMCPGGTLSLTVAASGVSTPCYQWRKNGVNLSNGGRVSGATSASLTITGLVSGDAGSYDAMATNTCGTQASNVSAVLVCIADFNCTGTVSIQDLFDYLGAWFAMLPSADVNHMNGVTIQDLFDFLAAWFNGC